VRARFTPEEIQRMLKLRSQDVPLKAIAIRFNAKLSSVDHAIRRVRETLRNKNS
jgi:hypothetical protein